MDKDSAAVIARGLLSYAPGPHTTTALLRSATPKLDNGSAIVLPYPADLGQPLAKLQYAVAELLAAHPGTDPARLSAAVSDTRIGVRRAIAANPALTEADQLRFLARAVTARDHRIVLTVLADSAPPAAVITTLKDLGELAEETTLMSQSNTAVIGRLVDNVARRSYRENLEMFDLGFLGVMQAMVTAAAHGLLPVDLDTLLDRSPALADGFSNLTGIRGTTHVYLRALRPGNGPPLSPNAVAVLIAGLSERNQSINGDTNMLQSVGCPGTLSSACVDALLNTDEHALHLLVATGATTKKVVLSDEQLGKLARSTVMSANAIGPMLLLSHDHLWTRLGNDELLALISSCGINGQMASRVIADRGATMTWPQLRTGLRHGDRALTLKWLDGQVGDVPTYDQITELDNDRGHCLGPGGGGRNFSDLLVTLRNMAVLPDILFARSVSHSFAALSAGSEQAAQFLARSFAAAFGDDPHRWDIAMTLGPDHPGTIEELVTTVTAVASPTVTALSVTIKA